jgi:ABC-2 type transport system permease protein
MTAVLAIFVQSLSPNKFVGWAIMVVYLISTLVLANMGFDHVLYRYGAGIGVPLSDMNGRGDFALFAAWVNAYWTAGAVILLVLGYGLWRRGTESRFLPRLKRLPHRLNGMAGLIGGVALAAFVGLGVFIFTNTNVWNEYRNSSDVEKLQANYEKTLLRFEATPQPSITDVRLDLDLHPHAPAGDARLLCDREQHRRARWAKCTCAGTTIWISRPDRPGRADGARVARVRIPYLSFRRSDAAGRASHRELRHGAGTARLQEQRQHHPPRRQRDLREQHGVRADDRHGPQQRPADRSQPSAANTACRPNCAWPSWRTCRRRARTTSAPTGSMRTSPSPPMRTRRRWLRAQRSDVTRNGRRTVRFVTEAPVLYFLSVQSAKYEITHQPHNGVDMVVYHDPGTTGTCRA